MYCTVEAHLWWTCRAALSLYTQNAVVQRQRRMRMPGTGVMRSFEQYVTVCSAQTDPALAAQGMLGMPPPPMGVPQWALPPRPPGA